MMNASTGKHVYSHIVAKNAVFSDWKRTQCAMRGSIGINVGVTKPIVVCLKPSWLHSFGNDIMSLDNHDLSGIKVFVHSTMRKTSN